MKNKETTMSIGKVILYKSPGGSTKIDVKLEEATVWLTPIQMAKLATVQKNEFMNSQVLPDCS